MLIDKHLRIAFLFSLGLHSLLLSPFLNLASHPLIEDKTDIEVTYIKVKKEESLDTKPLPIKDTKISLQEEKKIIPKEENIAQDVKPEKIAISEKREKPLQKERLKEPLLSKKGIDLSSVSLGDGTSDLLNYFSAIRNRINTYMHRNYNPSLGKGEVVLYFVLNSDGSVQAVSIIKDNLSNNQRLRNFCIKSIYHLSPFNSFPDDLDLAQEAFHIPISFHPIPINED